MMLRWNPIITIAATSSPSRRRRRTAPEVRRTRPPSRRGRASSVSREGSRSSGNDRWNRCLIGRERQIGLLLIIACTTNGKWPFSLDVAAPHQITSITSLAPTIGSASANRNVTAMAPYTSTRAARKIVLSRSPSSASTEEHQRDLPDRERRAVRAAGGEQRDQQRGDRRTAYPTSMTVRGCPRSAGPGPATVAAGWCRDAASRGTSRAAAGSAGSAARSRSRGRRPRRASSRAPPSGTRSARTTSRRRR